MKNDLEYSYFFDKLKQIYTHSKTVQHTVPENKIINSKQPNIYKKPKEEVKEQARIRKERQRQKQRKKYGDAEYKKMRAEEIAESRRKRKENDNSSNNL